ncbi:MAG: hypothetical protein WDW38_005161 [Sanguina aurantia]
MQDDQRAKKLLAVFQPALCTELLLVRHGETLWNLEARLQGQLHTAPGLNTRGRLQAQALAVALSTEHLDAIYSSDLLRCQETALAVASARAQHLQAVLDPRLRERHLGLLQGLTYSEAPVQQPAAWECLRDKSFDTAVLGGGESAEDVRRRVVAALEDIAAAHPGQRVLVVAHGGVLHAIYRHTMGRPFPGKVLNGSRHVLAIQGNKHVLRSWNDCSHLQEVGFLESSFGGTASQG